MTSRAAGTTYLSTNPRLLSITEEGLVTGLNASTTIQTGTIAVLHEGNLATIDFTAVGPSNDFDNDGMPNDYEDLFGLNKFARDAGGDLDCAMSVTNGALRSISREPTFWGGTRWSSAGW